MKPALSNTTSKITDHGVIALRQLRATIAHNEAFIGFSEPDPAFRPTFKVFRNTDVEYTSQVHLRACKHTREQNERDSHTHALAYAQTHKHDQDLPEYRRGPYLSSVEVEGTRNTLSYI